MKYIYGWLAVSSSVTVLYFVKHMVNNALRSEGKSADWAWYNTFMTSLAFLSLCPVAVVTAIVKKKNS